MNDPSTSEPTIVSVITDQDQRRIRAAMSGMPYAATNRVPKPWVAMGEVVDVDAVVAFLEGLASVLEAVAEGAEANRRRLFSLERDIEAVRRVLGTAVSEVPQ